MLDEGCLRGVDRSTSPPACALPVLMDERAPRLHRSRSTTSQRPLFRLLGTPEADKKHVLFESGHVPPFPDVVRETLDWLDRYLGPVTTGPPGP